MQTNRIDQSQSRARKQAVSQVRRHVPRPAFSTERFSGTRLSYRDNLEGRQGACAIRIGCHRLQRNEFMIGTIDVDALIDRVHQTGSEFGEEW